jgi:hypothetical protein
MRIRPNVDLSVSRDRLISSIGDKAALDLIEAHRGCPSFYVPKTARQEHHIEWVMGRPSFEAFVRAFGGKYICIPKK